MLSSWIAANKHGHSFFAFLRSGGGFSWWEGSVFQGRIV